jgi:hypothetical protein
MDARIEALFREYADAFSRLDGRRQAKLFADTFISAGPRGEIAVGKDQFVELSGKAAGFYRSVGQKKAELLSAEETPISPDYSLVKAHWGAWFEKTGDKPVEFDVSYIVHKTGGDPKVVLFITHQDEEEAMKQLGLLEEPARP